MSRKFPGKSYRKYENCWISEKRTIQPKIRKFQDESQIERKFPEKKKIENLGIPHEVVLFFTIYANYQFSTQR